jgi:hypothetical protein
MPKFTYQTIEVCTGANANIKEPCPAYVCGPLAAHRRRKKHLHSRWRITHVPTGLLLREKDYRTLTEAKQTILRLLTMPHDWYEITQDNCRTLVDVTLMDCLVLTPAELAQRTAAQFRAAG